MHREGKNLLDCPSAWDWDSRETISLRGKGNKSHREKGDTYGYRMRVWCELITLPSKAVPVAATLWELGPILSRATFSEKTVSEHSSFYDTGYHNDRSVLRGDSTNIGP